MRVKDKVAVVTGSGRGIGEATVRRLSEEGAKVVITDINEENAIKVANEIKAKGGQAIGVKSDVTKIDEVEALMKKAVEEFGKLDILVNNAGFNRDMLIKDMTEKDWDDVLDTDLKGAFLCAKFATKYMVEQKYGKVVNISSRAWHGNPGQANYSSAKAGIIGLTKSMAWEFGRFNINVNAIAPGIIATELMKGHPKFEMIKERQLANMPIKRLGEPIDVANTILFLVSDEASFISGEVIHVSGGRFG
ncbi:MAG: 3-oxoacyl-ACP reductase FabG [Deltaproteobacteria bacterium CG_4_8_14_3_um_filter_43_13]|nr:3-oxoacyl-ACP reductase FabG [Desulfobacterales bacterium]OIP30900.1 MAG: beta-ketoacyl-ACP reductase [Deltaproteobacteria bacterium CG2_30_43_15]PIU86863.1 MAG: 3-oxoacyl-ACP reductase FabG [Deltaproteobacteria bacterium CG06_land_8_20_14_3_00_44_19]PIX23799.1 MAG: 3-oxoacyl-ACP reductase FabG [Deltaproteobacteria bacterium CG_4_8_14_3_um_filter_43_13]PIZ20226.1 MAG: 3-oxoacyl-ACP reductase FabG [Deltaproteobacteria bacterium CG_4_10_14_0_8_um_filter_43_12]